MEHMGKIIKFAPRTFHEETEQGPFHPERTGHFGMMLTQEEPEGNFEMLHNSMFVQNREAMIRDFCQTEDLRIWTLQLFKAFGVLDDKEIEAEDLTNPDSFDEWIGALSWVYSASENDTGLISFLYWKLVGMAELQSRLKRYEDAELAGDIVWKEKP